MKIQLKHTLDTQGTIHNSNTGITRIEPEIRSTQGSARPTRMS